MTWLGAGGGPQRPERKVSDRSDQVVRRLTEEDYSTAANIMSRRDMVFYPQFASGFPFEAKLRAGATMGCKSAPSLHVRGMEMCACA